mmetsp:Transcript_152685/g.269523  ORF Transcript_152685/g.269523 Transcript_152685/m.269523 type:complete len:113 (-) Transcript_152685:236-574(-)
MTRALLASFLLILLGGSEALVASTKPNLKHMDNHKCKVMCQRFGMKALGIAFASIHHPTECCKKCDEVYHKDSQLQVAAAPKAAPQAVPFGSPTPPEGLLPPTVSGSTPVKR